jgi:transporter family-2 protein
MIANHWPHLLALLVGVGLTVQVGMNMTVARVVGTPLWAAVANFAVGLVALFATAMLIGSRPLPGTVGQVPLWAWLGGMLGAAYVASVTLLGPRIGAMTMVALVITGQLVAGIAVDHFGVLGYPRIPVSATRWLGAALLLAGALLVMRR